MDKKFIEEIISKYSEKLNIIPGNDCTIYYFWITAGAALNIINQNPDNCSKALEVISQDFARFQKRPIVNRLSSHVRKDMVTLQCFIEDYLITKKTFK